jgi:hypothetical protein
MGTTTPTQKIILKPAASLVPQPLVKIVLLTTLALAVRVTEITEQQQIAVPAQQAMLIYLSVGTAQHTIVYCAL